MEHSHTAHEAFLCSGEPWPAHGGSWIGHVLPGVFLLCWGLHWFVSASYQVLTGIRRQPAGAAHHKIVFLPGAFLQNLEPVLKIVFPAIAIILEFSLSGTRHLRCPAGTAKAGELDIQHMNSWSHGTNYPPIMLSGLVDLVHTYWVPLPQGVTHFYLASAFGSSSFLMLAHTKAEPLDGLVHQLLGYCMLAVAVTVLLQGFVRGHSFALNAAKSLALIMEGCWFFAITHIMFSSDNTWAARYPGDMTRTMFTPVLFTWIFIGVTAFLMLLYLAMQALLGALHVRPAAPHAKQLGANLKGRPYSGTGDDDDDVTASHCDSCFNAWGSRKRWAQGYFKVGTQQQLRGDVPMSDDASCEGSATPGSSDTSIEMV